MLLSFQITRPRACLSPPLRVVSSQQSPYSAIPPSILRFTASRGKPNFLRNQGIVDSNPRLPNAPSSKTLNKILTVLNYLKSKGFSDVDIDKLSYYCPKFFILRLRPADIEPVFDFLADDIGASTEDSRSLVLRCPELLLSNVEYFLRPTLEFLREVGVEKLNLPTNHNAHLLNTRVVKLQSKVEFLTRIGFTYDEAIKVCSRLPALFGYSIENNMEPKFVYLVQVMGKGLKELKEFPQYFAFSLRRRIVPRHMHLKQRNVDIPLRKMLLVSDDKFYAKWK